MNHGKVHKSGRDAPIEDPVEIREGLATLHREGVEFSIKVEGTSTLPYASMVKDLDLAKGTFALKLMRPLPHELMKGAEFRMLFAVADLRLEALIVFQGREEYLQYRFSLPTAFFLADRRREKRFPFRPRESAYVSAQDGSFPGLGVTGALVNLSAGGLALRVDRVLKLDDGMRIPPSTALFDRGRTFTRIRVLDVPRLPLFEASGAVTHATEKGSEIILGFQFTHLKDEARQALSEALAFREKLQRAATAHVSDSSGRTPSLAAPEPPAGAEAGEAPAPRGQVQGESFEEPLRMLARRCAGLVLMDPGPGDRERVLSLLRLHGFYRVDVAADAEEAQAIWTRSGRQPAALLACLAEGGEPLAGIRALERAAEPLAGVPLGILCREVDPAALMAVAPRTRLLGMDPRSREESQGLATALEALAGLLA